MRVFVTGASGHIGSALLPELLGAGHEVVGLARSEESAAVIGAAGAQVAWGGLDDLDRLRDAAAAADGVIHLAFNQNGDREDAVATDLRALETIGDALQGTGKPLVSTSGTLMLAFAGLDRVGTEADFAEAGPRIDAENAVIALANHGVRSSIIRLPPTVHSSLDHHGFIPRLIAIAHDQGVASYVGDGPTAGPPGTRSTPPASTGWRWNSHRPAPGCTRSATRASRSATSPKRSVATSSSPRAAFRRPMPMPTSAFSARSSSSTTRRRAR